MTSKTSELFTAGLIKPPRFVEPNVMYETITGSLAYGVSSDASDMDIYGFCIPPPKVVFPHLDGRIEGFGRQKKNFDQFQSHGISHKGKDYDISIYNIVKYFSLCMENNPDMIDSLFTPANCVVFQTQVGQMVREKRRIFLHKGSWHKFKGYAYSQLHKMSNKKPVGKRMESVEKYGYDVKFAYHVVRLLDEAEQILVNEDIDLQRNREHLKAIRKGEVSESDIRKWAASKEHQLETAYANSKLRHSPDEEAIRDLLLQCLEHHHGSLESCITDEGRAVRTLQHVVKTINEGMGW